MALLRLNRPKQSIWAFRTALVARPIFPAALMALGSAGIKVGDHDAARDGFSGLLAIEPDNAIALRGLEKITFLLHPRKKHRRDTQAFLQTPIADSSAANLEQQ